MQQTEMQITKSRVMIIVLVLFSLLSFAYRVGQKSIESQQVKTKCVETKRSTPKHLDATPVSRKNADSNPTVLGLTLGQSTLADVEKQYEIISSSPGAQGTNLVEYKIKINNIPISGLETVNILCSDKDNIVEVISLNIDKSRFDDFYKELSKKYDLIRSKIPFVGDKFAAFRHGHTLIEMSAPHLSFTMTLVYVLRDTAELVQQLRVRKIILEKEREQKLL